MQNNSLQELHQRYIQQANWTKNLREYFFSQWIFPQHAKIIEIGCGTGALLAQITKAYNHKLYGIDIDFKVISFAQKQTYPYECVQADAHKLPFSSNSFQLCLCHYFLLWSKNPLVCLTEMKRILTPHGIIFVIAEPDYGGRIDEPELLQKMGQLQKAALEKKGADTLIGRKLRGLMHHAGFTQIESGVIGGEWGSHLNTKEIELEWKTFLSDVKDSTSTEALSNMYNVNMEAYKNGERILFIPTFYAIAKKP